MLSRKDVKHAIAVVYDETARDGKEHGFIVTATGVQIQLYAEEMRTILHLHADTIAIFHTHAVAGSNQPSHADVVNLVALQAEAPGVCSYVLGHTRTQQRTVYEIFPDGTVKMVSIF